MLFVATWVDLDIIILSEVSQTEKDKYHMTLLTCGLLKNYTNGNSHGGSVVTNLTSIHEDLSSIPGLAQSVG